MFWPNYEVNVPTSREDYYRRLCLLFIPWRNESKVKGIFIYYEDRWNNFMDVLNIRSPLAYNDIRLIIKSQETQLNMEKELFDRRKKMNVFMAEENIEFEDEENIEVFDRDVNIEQHTESIKLMNDEQKNIFNYIINNIVSHNIFKILTKINLKTFFTIIY